MSENPREDAPMAAKATTAGNSLGGGAGDGGGPTASAPVPREPSLRFARPSLPSRATLENVDTFIISHQASAARDLMNLGIIAQMKWHPECATPFSYTCILPSINVWHALSPQHCLTLSRSNTTRPLDGPDAKTSHSKPDREDDDVGPRSRICVLVRDFETFVAQVRIKVAFPDGYLGLFGDHVQMNFDETHNTLTVSGMYGVVALREKSG